jgi:GT2 family glycosyltransferase
MPPDLSLCIINHQTPELATQCLESVRGTAGDLTAEVFLVNNTPDDEAELRAQMEGLPGSHFIQNTARLGFAANQNQMMRQATGAYWIPLNSDTVLRPGALQALKAFMDVHPRVGMAGPRLEHANGQLLPSARNFPTPMTHLLEASGMWQLLRGQRWPGRWLRLSHPHDTTLQVDWLSGACLIVRPEAARQVGLYDEALFPGLYGEDLEWCWRMRQAGWQVAFTPEAVVVHAEGQSPLADRSLQMYRGLYAFCARHYSTGKRCGIRLATVAALLPRWLFARSRAARAQYAHIIRLPMPRASRHDA